MYVGIADSFERTMVAAFGSLPRAGTARGQDSRALTTKRARNAIDILRIMNSSPDQPLVRGRTPNPRATVDDVVDRILQVVPRTMTRIRTEMRTAGSNQLTVPQLRALLFVRRHPGASLSPLAEHLGMALPATSNLVERLVQAGLVERTTNPDERRRIQLTLTAMGAEHVERAQLLVRSRLRADLTSLSPTDLGRLAGSLEVLAKLAREQEGRQP
jgi:DNA-binding MarR family transcriptional regulator